MHYRVNIYSEYGEGSRGGWVVVGSQWWWRLRERGGNMWGCYGQGSRPPLFTQSSLLAQHQFDCLLKEKMSIPPRGPDVRFHKSKITFQIVWKRFARSVGLPSLSVGRCKYRSITHLVVLCERASLRSSLQQYHHVTILIWSYRPMQFIKF